jgi:uncharacterized protein
MIRIKVLKKNNNIEKITFRGHANYAEYGKDIVCAAASATVLTTINGILSLDSSTIDVIQKDNNIDISIIKHNNISDKLLSNMLNSLKTIKSNYPKNIEIIEEE